MQVAVPKTEKEILDLIDVALSGEDVVITSADRAAIRLVPVPQEETAQRPRFIHGVLKDVLKGPIPDFLEPMSEEDLRLWEGRD